MLNLTDKQIDKVVKELKKPKVAMALASIVAKAIIALKKERVLTKEKRDRIYKKKHGKAESLDISHYYCPELERKI